MTTQFGMEGCALIHMLAQVGAPATVVYLDTHFFFRETYELRDRLVDHYPTIHFENRGALLTCAEQEKLYGPELWRSDPDRCCQIRKVEPMQRVLEGVDAWITGIRRDQSSSRSAIRQVEWDWQFDLLKISPLAAWTRGQVWDYVRGNNAPYNPLHEREYPSIGCTHCTKPVPGSTPSEYSREGRWSQAGKTECGLHVDNDGPMTPEPEGAINA